MLEIKTALSAYCLVLERQRLLSVRETETAKC